MIGSLRTFRDDSADITEDAGFYPREWRAVFKDLLELISIGLGGKKNTETEST